MIAAVLWLLAAQTGVPQPDLPNVVLEQALGRFYSPAYRACQAKAVTTLDIATCSGAEAARWDRRLNAAYRKDMAAISPAEKADLQKAQRAWIAYRDANCAAYVHPEDWGTMSQINGAECRLGMTAARALELEDFPPSGCGKAQC